MSNKTFSGIQIMQYERNTFTSLCNTCYVTPDTLCSFPAHFSFFSHVIYASCHIQNPLSPAAESSLCCFPQSMTLP